MERVKIKDGTTWPNPSGKDFQALAWRLRYAQDSIEKGCFFAAAEIIEAYELLIFHPAFTLKKVQDKVSGIRKAIKNNQSAQLCDCEDGVYPGSITYCVACGKDINL